MIDPLDYHSRWCAWLFDASPCDCAPQIDDEDEDDDTEPGPASTGTTEGADHV